MSRGAPDADLARCDFTEDDVKKKMQKGGPHSVRYKFFRVKRVGGGRRLCEESLTAW